MNDGLPRAELSPMQLGLLYPALAAPERWTHAGPGACALSERLDHAAFAEAWRVVVARHPLLRARFDWSDPELPVQVVEPALNIAVERHELACTGPDRVRELMTHHLSRAFDLARAPLIRIVTVSLSDRDWCFVAASRFLLDPWSVESLLRETLDVYRSLRAGAPPPDAPRPGYGQHMEGVGDADLRSAEEFWRGRLAEPAADLPIPAAPGKGHETYCAEPLRVDAVVAAGLRELAAANGCRLSTVMTAAWALLLSRHSGGGTVVFDVRTSGRGERETVLGPLETAVPLAGAVDEDGSAAAHLAAWRARERETSGFSYAPPAMIRAWSPTPELPVAATEVNVAALDAPGPGLGEHELVTSVLAPADLDGASDHLVEARWRLANGVPEGSLVYRRDRLHPDHARRMAGHLHALLAQLACVRGRPVRELSMLTAAEERRLVAGWNDTAAAAGVELVHQLVSDWAERTPDAVAIQWRGKATSYRDLDRAANRWANHLRSLGVGPEVLAGVLVDRSPELLAVMLGVLKAGGAYLPLDPAYPAERIAYMLRDAGARVVVSSRPGDRIAGLDGVRVVGLDDAASASPLPPAGDARPDNVAYVLYTSGSTGAPKGVAISHRSAANLLQWARETLAGDLRSVLATTSISFDCSIVEIFGPLTSGGTAVLLPGLLEAATEPGATGRLVHGVPSALHELALAGRLPGSARTVLVGGEALPVDLVDLLHRQPPVERVLNVYGPTETTTYATACVVRPNAGEAPSIGGPIANVQVHICDSHLRPVPVGVTGELYVGGLGVARGYLGRPGLTAERFVPDHLGPCQGERLYRTGDLGRRRENGTIEFLGRVDQQVKVRGYRVEPEEVRTALVRHPAVRSAVVGPWAEGRERCLVAYVVIDPRCQASADDLREHLARSVPTFMVPAHIVLVDRMPLLPNGKVNRAALPAPHDTRPAAEPAPPRTADEHALAAIWRELLGAAHVGVDDDFFELGGHSLVALRVQSRIQADLGVELPLRLLFQARTIGRLALAVALARNAGVATPDGDLEQGEV